MNLHVRILYCLIVLKQIVFLCKEPSTFFSLLIILFLFTRGGAPPSFNDISTMPRSSGNCLCDVSWMLSLDCDLLLFDCHLVSFFAIHPEFCNQLVWKIELWILKRNPSIFHISVFHQCYLLQLWHLIYLCQFLVKVFVGSPSCIF